MMKSRNIAAKKTTSSGPKCFSGGNVMPAKRRAPCTSSCRLSRR